MKKEGIKWSLSIVVLVVFFLGFSISAFAKSGDKVSPAWTQILPADDGDADGCGSSRFDCVLDDADGDGVPDAVLDKETGLVWERSPDTAQNWEGAMILCDKRSVGNRYGWRLPTVNELASLLDTSVVASPTLPTGHPFINVLFDAYWTSSAIFGSTIEAYAVIFELDPPLPLSQISATQRIFTLGMWCVRGGPEYDGY